MAGLPSGLPRPCHVRKTLTLFLAQQEADYVGLKGEYEAIQKRVHISDRPIIHALAEPRLYPGGLALEFVTGGG